MPMFLFHDTNDIRRFNGSKNLIYIMDLADYIKFQQLNGISQFKGCLMIQKGCKPRSKSIPVLEQRAKTVRMKAIFFYCSKKKSLNYL